MLCSSDFKIPDCFLFLGVVRNQNPYFFKSPLVTNKTPPHIPYSLIEPILIQENKGARDVRLSAVTNALKRKGFINRSALLKKQNKL
jgi:hypothetical protein